MTPGRFDLTPASGLPGEPRVVRVRVYVDRDYRYQMVNKRVEAMLGKSREELLGKELRELYGEGPLEIDFKAFGERASRVSMTRCELLPVVAERTSRNTGQRHSPQLS